MKTINVADAVYEGLEAFAQKRDLEVELCADRVVQAGLNRYAASDKQNAKRLAIYKAAKKAQGDTKKAKAKGPLARKVAKAAPKKAKAKAVKVIKTFDDAATAGA